MECTGRLLLPTLDYNTGRLQLSLIINEDVRAEYERLKDCEKLSISIKKYRKRRSLDANAYYWQLLTKLSETLHVSKPYLHNDMLRKYGQAEYYGDKQVYITIPDTEEAQNKADEDEYTHLKPTSQIRIGKDGVAYRTYKLLRGSHSYNTKEMSVLIDGLVSECKENGIETLPPEELQHLKDSWKG